MRPATEAEIVALKAIAGDEGEITHAVYYDVIYPEYRHLNGKGQLCFTPLERVLQYLADHPPVSPEEPAQ